MVDGTHFLTPEGRKKLEEELEYLRTIRRTEVAQSLKSAIDEGDLSENAGYEEAKREQAFVEGRIRSIEAILGNAQVLESNGEHEIAALGATVTILEDGGEPEEYQIVGRTEADPLQGRISNESPLGKALIGKRVGDVVKVNTPGGAMQVKIVSIA